MKCRIDPRGVSAWRAFLATHALLVEQVDRRMAERGLLPSSSLEILSALEAAPGGALRMSELARAVAMSPSGLTRHADRLEKEGFLERIACAKDRRATYAAITDAGKAALKKAWIPYQEAIEACFLKPLTCAQIGALDETLAMIREAR